MGLLLLMSSAQAQIATPNAPPEEKVLFSGSLSIPARHYKTIAFTTSAAFTRARIAGNVRASGGASNDIRILVLKNEQLIYDSGQRRSVVLSVDFSEPGQYTLVFDNRFSALSAKTVGGAISLVTWGIDAQATKAYREEQTRRIDAVAQFLSSLQGIMDRLFDTLKSDEAGLGTHQLDSSPRIQVEKDPSINAHADWRTNTMFVNVGLVAFAHKQGNQAESIVAGVFAHELAHIFYRHDHLSKGGLISELENVSPLDRVQETEADILGIRVACRAGYAPDGPIILLEELIREHPGPVPIGSDHPSSASRLHYLQSEASKCQIWQSQRSPSTSPAPPLSSLGPDTARRLDLSSGTTWRLEQAPDSRWVFTATGDTIHGERILSEQHRQLGDYDAVDIVTLGGNLRGVQNERITFRVKDPSSPQGFKPNACSFQFQIYLTDITHDRIEGRWQGYPKDSKYNPETCVRSGEKVWDSVVWVRELDRR